MDVLLRLDVVFPEDAYHTVVIVLPCTGERYADVEEILSTEIKLVQEVTFVYLYSQVMLGCVVTKFHKIVLSSILECFEQTKIIFFSH